MNSNKLHLTVLALIITGVTLVSSCKKKESTPTSSTTTTADSDQSGAKANSKAEDVDADIISIGSEACDKSSTSLDSYRSMQSTNLSCATVTVDTATKIVTVAFSGNVCLDGKVRTGTLYYNYSASPAGAKHYRDPGFSFNVTSSNYAVDGNTVTINNKTVTNVTPAGFNPLTTNETWSITASLSIALSNGGGTISWTCNRVKTLLNTATAYTNANTPIAWSIARIGFTGSAAGTRSNGETFTVNITSQMIKDFGACNVFGWHPFIQGTFVYSPQGKAARTFDYGTGTCDLNATVTINGITYSFLL